MNLQESIRRILREDNNRKERTHYRQYKLGDVIDGSKLDTLSGGLVGNDNNQYVLVQYPLYKFPYTRQDLIDFDPEYEEEEIWRLESIKDNFDKTPPIPQEGDGMHRIIAAKELGYKTILMWKKITNLQESIRKILKEEFTEDKNLYGEKLKPCSTKPMTGYYRDGYCRTGDDDTGSHTVCARVTEEFLEFTKSMGNNLDMLEPGDKWCLCAKRWEEANKEGVAPKMIKRSTNIKTLDIIDSDEQELDEYARTLKNTRRQGSGLRFQKSVVKSNPSRFRKYSREYINEIEFDDRTKKDYKVKTNFIKIFIEKNFGDLICGFHWDPINYVVNTKVYWPGKNLGAARIVLHIPNDKFEELETNDFLKKQDLKDQILQFPMFNQVFVTFDSTKCDEEMNESELTEKCWKGYTQKGMKTMFGKRYPNCVKKKK